MLQIWLCLFILAFFSHLDYLNELREGILEAYTGIVQGLRGDGETPSEDLHCIEPSIPFMIHFIITLAQDPEISDNIVACAIGLLYDLVSNFGAKLLPLVESEPLIDLINKGKRSRTHKTKVLANYTYKSIRQLKNQANVPSSW